MIFLTLFTVFEGEIGLLKAGETWLLVVEIDDLFISLGKILDTRL